jgi:hypothetical protein
VLPNRPKQFLISASQNRLSPYSNIARRLPFERCGCLFNSDVMKKPRPGFDGDVLNGSKLAWGIRAGISSIQFAGHLSPYDGLPIAPIGLKFDRSLESGQNNP